MIIRYWTPKDAPTLKAMMLAFLEEHYALGGAFKPTEYNAALLTRMGLDAAERKEPALVAVEGDAIVGLNLWYGLNSQFDLRAKTLLGFCTYVMPAWRRQRVANTLRAAAVAVGYTGGFEQVEGTVIHKEGMASVHASGGKPSGTLMRGELAKLIWQVPPGKAQEHDYDTDASLWH